MEKKHQAICSMRIDSEDFEPITYRDALKDKEHLELLQPDNIYRIEEIEAVRYFRNHQRRIPDRMFNHFSGTAGGQGL